MRPSARTFLLSSLLGAGLCPSVPQTAEAAPRKATARNKETREDISKSRTDAGGSALSRLAQLVSEIDIDEPSLVVFGAISAKTSEGASLLSKEAQDSLHRTLLRIVGSSITSARLREQKALSLKQASTRARRSNLALVYVQPLLIGGHLELDLEVIKWPHSFWQRSLLPQGTVSHHSSFRVLADATIRRLLPPAPGLFMQKSVYRSPFDAPSALACGDLNTDGGNELLVVGRHQIALGRFISGTFLVERQKSWSSLSEVSPSPLRAPLAAASIAHQSAAVGISDRKHSLFLNALLEVTSRHPPRFPLGNKLCAEYTPTGLNTHSLPCDSHQRPKNSHSPVRSFDAFAHGSLTEENGTLTKVTASVAEAQSFARIEILSTAQKAKLLEVNDVGSALLWADLDGDGSLEFISSRAVRAPESDALVIRTLKNGTLTELASWPGGPVHALTVCPFSGTNPLSLVAAVGNELWVLR